ncbi:hypothetical protein INT48_005550 [Thamnidium elegans]|uniref:Protein kinase domain-containing protein n=1 Tax=Thamnidium elegans TaxID=101142 RepID=A0A8H7SXS5_9FUNG|nr:hypothetical protein INT48_005550 [Thamnidium elegans]
MAASTSPNVFSPETSHHRKRDLSASPSSPQPTTAPVVKRSKIDNLFYSPTQDEHTIADTTNATAATTEQPSDEELQSFWNTQSPVMEYREPPATPVKETGNWAPTFNLMDNEDAEEEEFMAGQRFSLGEKPFRRSLYSELLSSSNIAAEDDDVIRRSRRKSAIITSSLFEDEIGEIQEEDEEDEEDEKTTMPLSRPYIPKSIHYDDEVDAFFSSNNNPAADEPEYVLSSALKMSLLQQQHRGVPMYITEWPHFLTLDYFKHHGPQDRVIEDDKPIRISTTPYFDAKFSILKSMGSGEYAEVWKVLELSSKQMFAVKKSKVPFTGWEDRWHQLIEVENLRCVKDSRYCVDMMNAWEERGFLYIQLELCSSGSLDKYIKFKERKIPEEIVWRIFREISLGLNDIHEANIVHLDLKPTNILIDDKGFIKIGDFGISVRTPVDMRWVKGEGDRRYMAPDLLREEFDKPADIFSLGMILLELATGIVLPGTGESWEMLRTGDFSKQKKALSKLSTDMRDMIEWLLITSRRNRPTIQQIINHPRFLEQEESTSCLLSYVYEMERIAAEEAEKLAQRNIFNTPEGRML